MSGQLASRERVDFRPVGFFVARTPLLPIDDFLTWGSSLQAIGALDDDASIEAALDTDNRRLRQYLDTFLDRPEVAEALAIASPAFTTALEEWRQDSTTRKGVRVGHSLVRYFTRMTSRPSPFGLFSGWTVGYIGSATQLRVQGVDCYRRRTQVDGWYVTSVARSLATDPQVADHVTFEPNETIYECAGAIKYADASPRGPLFHRTAKTPQLLALLQAARDGATVPQIAQSLRSSIPGLAAGAADAYVRSAVQAGLLRCRLTPPVTGKTALDALMAAAAEMVLDTPITHALSGLARDLETLDERGVRARSGYEDVVAKLPRIAAPVRPERSLCVNLIKPAQAVSLGPEVIDELQRAVAVLCRVGVSNPHHDEALAGFREAFRERFGHRHVRLVELFDDETGLRRLTDLKGLTPLLKDLPIGSSAPVRPAYRAHERLRRKIARAAESYAPEVVLRAEDLDEDGPVLPLPESFHIALTLEAESDVAVSQGRFRIVLHGIAGPPGTRTLGRFCLSDPELHELVVGAARLDAQNRPGALYAEIAYAPWGPARNVVERPAFHEYEIPYLGRSGVPKDKQILVSDLWVSVSGERIIFYSGRLGRQVIPQITSAHVYWSSSMPPMYRFLCQVARTRVPVSPFWEADERRPVYVPRVTFGRVVLSPAQWRVDTEDFKRLPTLRGTAQFKAVQQLRERLHWPRYIGYIDGEKFLLVDLDNPLSTAAFVPLLKGRLTTALFTEWIPGADMQPFRGPEGRFAHELMVPCVLPTSRPAPDGLRRSVSASMATTSTGRTRHPGSEWLYVKLYANPRAIDRVLRELVGPLVATWFAEQSADRWFFIRYQDPEPHLRVRVRGARAGLFAYHLEALCRRIDDESFRSVVWKLQCETYDREVERYGGMDGIDLAERLFQADSECVLSLLSTAWARDPTTRWMLAAKGIDVLLADFGLALADRKAFIRRYKEGWWQLFKGSTALRRDLAVRFRRERSRLESVLLESREDMEPVRAAFLRRSAQVSRLVTELSDLEAAKRLTVSCANLHESYVHMHVNRLMPAKNTSHELVIADFLSQFYESQLARVTQMV